MFRQFKWAVGATVTATLLACGGGGSGSEVTNQLSTLTLTGVAATGLAMPSANVSAKCQIGSGFATTASSGAYSMEIRGGALPCMLEVANPIDDTKFHSLATGGGTNAVANLTPLTELVTARLFRQNPANYFAALTSGNLATTVTVNEVAAANNDVITALTGTVDTTAIGNFMSTPMIAATLASPASGDAHDKVLDALRAKLTPAHLNQVASLLASATDANAVRTLVGNIVTAASKYTVSGSVIGLTDGNTVTILNNGGNATSTANGNFSFGTPLAYNGSYSVTVGTQPTGQTCTISNGSGSGVVANVSNVSVICNRNTYTVGGTVAGLSIGKQVTLLSNAANPTIIAANGNFSFSTPLAYNGSYSVTVGTQPTGQTCTISNGSGSGVVANVSNVSVICNSSTYTISGTVSGLSIGKQVTLLNNAANPTIVAANGNFSFSTPLAYNGSYSVTVGTQPTGQTCTIGNGIGSSVVANVSNVSVICNSAQQTGISVSVLGDNINYLASKKLNILKTFSGGSSLESTDGYTSTSRVAACSFNDLGSSVGGFRPSSFSFGGVSGYSTARANFLQLVPRAQAGEFAALSVLRAAAVQFLNASRGMYASGSYYKDDLDLVINALAPTYAPALLETKIIADNSCALGRWQQYVFEVEIDRMTAVSAFNRALTEYSIVFQKAKYGNIEASWRYFEILKNISVLANSLGNNFTLQYAALLNNDLPVIMGYQRQNSSVLIDSQGLATAVMLDDALVTVCQSGFCSSTLIAVRLP